MKCTGCQFDNRQGVKFCESCGARMGLACPRCGTRIPEDRLFCGECGHDLRSARESVPLDYSEPKSYIPGFLADRILTTRRSLEGERKLVTVLFADVANYTGISEKLDPEEIHRIMDGLFRILVNEIHRYEGTIDKFTGDGIMALFGAPLAHEDHAQRACRAALSIRQAVEPYSDKIRGDYGVEFKMRMGLNSGTVLVGSIGDDLKMDYTAIGDTTNLASRMESMAQPGTILVSGHTQKLVRDLFSFKSLGEVRVKGKEKLQVAYELVRAGEIETRIEASAARGLTRFVGRREEMETLRECFEKARSGSGQVIGIVGEAGVGKSRLLLEFRNRISEEEHAYLEGRCLHYGRSTPYLPILGALRSYFGIREEDQEDTIKEKIGESLLQLDPMLRLVPPSLHELLSLTVEDKKYLQLDPQQKREKTFETLRDLFVRLSHRNPLVFAVEDLHWIDKTSQEFLEYLIGWLPNTPILLALLHRPEYTHPWGSRSYYTHMGVTQLSAPTSAELVEAILEEGKMVPELKELILGRAGGNPLFVEELTHSLLENGSICRQEDHYVLARKISEIHVPETIQGIIAARMDRIEESLKRIMQVASVIGREFAYRILAAITGLREELKSCLLNLQGLEFIYEKQLFPELEYVFKHALTQEVAYNSLLIKRRRAIHENIGKAIEGLYAERLEECYELLAYHFTRSDNSIKALEYLDLANRKAANVNAVEDAKAYFENAMELLDRVPETQETRDRRISLLVNQMRVFHLLLNLPAYHDLLKRYKPLAARAEDPGLRGAFYARLGSCETIFGSLEQSLETLAQAAELCELGGNPEYAGFVYGNLVFIHFHRGEFDKALEAKEEVLRKMGEHFNLQTYVRALANTAVALSHLGHWNKAEEDGKRALSVAEEFSDNSQSSYAAMCLSNVYTAKGDLDRGTEYGELAVQKAPTPADKAWAQGALAWTWCRAGEPNKGIEVLVPLVQIFRAVGLVPSQLGYGMFLGDGYLLAGEYEKAKQTVEEVLEIANRCGSRLFQGWTHVWLGEIALKANPAQAHLHFQRSIAIAQGMKAENHLALAYAGYGRLLKEQGNIEQARDYLTRALEIFERLGTLLEPDKARKELDDLPTP